MDSWPTLIAMQTGAFMVPVLTWPPDRTHIIEADPDEEPDIDLPPLPPEPEPLTAAEVAILAHLADDGPVSMRAVAKALGVARRAAWKGLERLRVLGLVQLGDRGWQVGEVVAI